MVNGFATGTQRERPLIEGVVRSLPLFWSLGPAQRQSLSAGCWALSAARGVSLVQAGTRLPGIFAVAYGSVKLSLRNGGGTERLLRVVAARQTFGEASALLGRPAPYEAIAVADTKLVVIPSAPLVGLLEREAGFAKALVTSLAEGQLQLCAEVRAAALQSGAERLARYLDQLASDGATDKECAVQLPFTKTLLAARLGMKKETFSRLLRQLANAGVIAVSRRSVAIRDRERLRAAAGIHGSGD